MRKSLFLLSSIVLLTACEDPSSVDQCLRVELFKQCLQDIPTGPKSIHNSNDWDEVVKGCDTISYWQARRNKQQITKECLP